MCFTLKITESFYHVEKSCYLFIVIFTRKMPSCSTAETDHSSLVLIGFIALNITGS